MTDWLKKELTAGPVRKIPAVRIRFLRYAAEHFFSAVRRRVLLSYHLLPAADDVHTPRQVIQRCGLTAYLAAAHIVDVEGSAAL